MKKVLSVFLAALLFTIVGLAFSDVSEARLNNPSLGTGTTTFSGALQTSSTFQSTGLATFYNGFISLASSTAVQNLQVGTLGVSSTLTISGGRFGTAGGTILLGMDAFQPILSFCVTSAGAQCSTFVRYMALNDFQLAPGTQYRFGQGTIQPTLFIQSTGNLNYCFICADTNNRTGIGFQQVGGDGGYIRFYSNSDASSTLRLVMSDIGNFGINTTTPSSTISVQGNGLISGNLLVGGFSASNTLALSNTQRLASTTVDIYFASSTSQGAGPVVVSPDRTCYRIVAANGGALSSVAITCPTGN